MADKPFGVKQLHVVGAAGTPVIESQTTLKIGGQQVAITTNTSVSGVVTATAFVGDGSGLTGVSGGSAANLTATTLDVTGICAGSFVTDLITADGTGRGFCTRYYVTANGAFCISFCCPGQRNTVRQPNSLLNERISYMFENSTGSSHPFRIQFTNTSVGVGTYVSGDQNGTQIFTIPHDAPASYEYVCTIHGGMKGSFVILVNNMSPLHLESASPEEQYLIQQFFTATF